jgi:hypothetical protein
MCAIGVIGFVAEIKGASNTPPCIAAIPMQNQEYLCATWDSNGRWL